MNALLERVKAARASESKGPPKARPGLERVATRTARSRCGTIPLTDPEHDPAAIERELREMLRAGPVPSWTNSGWTPASAECYRKGQTATEVNTRRESQLRAYQRGTFTMPEFRISQEMVDFARRMGPIDIWMDTSEPVAKARPAPRPVEPLNHGANYLKGALHDPESIIQKFEAVSACADFDTLIGRGLSGALVVPWLARRFGKSWAIVRKEDDGSHSSAMIEGRIGRRYVFVDDLICSGDTLLATLKTLHMQYLHVHRMQPPELVGAFMYNWTPSACWCDPVGSRELSSVLRAYRRSIE